MRLTAVGMDRELSRVEAQSLLRGKFLSISLKGNEYCFKVIAVRDIIPTPGSMKHERDPGIIKDDLCGSIRYKNAGIPVFDLRAPAEPFRPHTDEHCFIITLEAIANGLLLELGLLTDKISAVLNRTMAEMSEDIIRSRLRGTMPFSTVKIQSYYKKI